MADNLTDKELRESLKKLGFDAGPITESTRSVYEKKLLKLMEMPKPPPASPTRRRRGKTQSVIADDKEESKFGKMHCCSLWLVAPESIVSELSNSSPLKIPSQYTAKLALEVRYLFVTKNDALSPSKDPSGSFKILNASVKSSRRLRLSKKWFRASRRFSYEGCLNPEKIWCNKK
ncbi:unnamed protein product [Echinostoma caproni]|uniref:LEM domain-containing protein n=1 Tax=Echinostoma caproni TaxID=27848 RepID=A0A183B1Q0_9TREM|nr:unnamed protein product [Echinostoma caproni]